jgi:xanthine/CO dehydrogenase XdhC/CoxF family maturation factor
MKDIYDILRQWRKRPDANFAFATMVRAQGSSYRRPGARMLICEDGTTIGSLSAGCLETEVAECAREVLRTGQSVIVSFDTRRRFGCAGKIDIFIERIGDDFFADLAENLQARRVHVAITRFEGEEFVENIFPPLRLLIFGDGPDNAPFRSLGHFLGWEIIEIIDVNLFSIAPDAWTAAIVKSHNYGRDFVTLQKLLPLELRYVGLIGPRKRRDQILSELLEVGITVNAGFFAPAGLNLGAETPEEIALEVVAEIQRVFAHGSGLSLREKKIPIHAALKYANSPALSER